MAAATTTTATSSFSTSKPGLRNRLTKHLALDPLTVKFSFTKASNSLSQQQKQHFGIEPIHIGSYSRKWRVGVEAVEAGPSDEAVAAEGEEEEEEAKKSSEEIEAANTKLYVGNLPYLCDSAQLAGIVQQYGTPELVEVLYDRDTGKSRGFAFVTMSSIEDCDAVIENLDASEFGGRYLRVNYANKPRKKVPLIPETEHKLFIGNLSWSVTSEILQEVFQECGTVVGARVLYDGETGRSRGYGFVCYSTRAEMEAAINSLDGLEVEGRPIRISLAEGKKS